MVFKYIIIINQIYNIFRRYLIISIHYPIFTGIALLEGGNSIIQHSIFTKLQNGEISQAFLKVKPTLSFFLFFKYKKV